MRAKFVRKKKADYPESFRRINRKFLADAGMVVQGAAIQLVPVDTGLLRSSIKSESDDDRAIVAAGAEYATHVEYGTRRMSAQPYMRPALDKNRKALIKQYRDYIREEFHGR